MSTTVDEKIVSMQFDNRNFEKNTKETIKSLQQLENASYKAGFSVGDVGKKMSSFAEWKIARNAINSMANVFNQLTFDPIKLGLQEYETQINSIQTILANTESKGTGIKEVNAALDELNKYADKTIYNFTQMTQNIGKFTAAGVDLDTSVSAIKGIANLAAVSGSSSQQASTAMYQLSQAIASGVIRLQDWNSVVNANMGGELFQKALMDTARVHGIAIDDMLESEGTFRETLKEGWLTSDILTETLEKFTMATEGVSEAEIEANRAKLKSIGYTEKQIEEIFKLGDMATNAATKVKTLSQLFDTLKESAQSGWTQTFELIIGDFYEAQEVWTKVSDTVGGFIQRTSESRNQLLASGLQSGWKNLINAGAFDESGLEKQIKNVAKSFNISIDDMAKEGEKFEDTLQRLMNDNIIKPDMLATAVNNLSSKYSQYTDEQLKAMGVTREQVDALEALNGKIQHSDKYLGNISDKLKRVSGRKLLLESFGNIFQALVKPLGAVADAFSDIFTPATGDSLYNLIEGFRDFTASLIPSSEQLELIKRNFKGLFATLDIGLMFAKSIFGIVRKLISSLTGVTNAVLGVGASFGDAMVALRDFLKGSESFTKFENFVGGGIVYIVTRIKELFATIKEGPKGDGFSKFVGWLKKAWSAVKDFGKKIGQGFKEIGQALGNFFSENFSKENFLANIENVFDIIATGLLSGTLAGLITAVTKLIKKFKEKIDLDGLIDEFGKLIEGIRKPLEAVQSKIKAQAIKTIATAVVMLVGSVIVLSMIDSEKTWKAIGAIGALMSILVIAMWAINRMSATVKKQTDVKTIKNGFKSFSLIQESISSAGKNVVETKKNVGLLLSLSTSILLLAKALHYVKDMGWKELGVGLLSMAGCMVILMGAMALINVISKMNVNANKQIPILIITAGLLSLLAIPLKKLGQMSWTQMGVGLIAMSGCMVALMGSIAILKLISKIDGKTHMEIAALVTITMGLTTLGLVMKSLSGLNWKQMGVGLISVTGCMSILLGAITILKLTTRISDTKGLDIGGLVTMTMALGTLGLIMKSLSDLTWTQMGIGLLAMTGCMTILLGALTLLKLVNQINSVGDLWSLISLSAGLILVSASLKILASLSWEQMGIGLLAMAGCMTILSGTMAVLASITKISTTTNVGSLIVMVLALTMVTGAIFALGSMNWTVVAQGLGAMAVALTILAGTLAVLATATKIAGGTGILLAAASLVALSTAIYALLPAIAILGNMKIKTLAVGLGAIVVAFAALGAVALLLQPAIPAMTALAGALTLLGVGCLTAGAGVFLMVAALSLLITTLTSVTAEGAKDIVLALKAIIEGVASMIPFVVEKLGEAIVAFCGVIVKSAPAIGKAIVSVILSVLDVLVTVIPVLADGILRIIVGVLDALATYIPNIAESLFKIILGLFNKLAEYVPDLTQALFNVFMGIFVGLAEAFRNMDTSVFADGFKAVGVLAAMLAALGAISLLVPGAMIGLLGLGLIVGELSLILAGLGALSRIKGLKELIADGGGLLEAIGTAIGRFVGGLAGGVASGVSSSLPLFAANLSAFMIMLKPFLDGINGLDSDAVNAAKTLASVILTITGTSILSAISSFLSFGDSSMTKFAKGITALGDGIYNFNKKVTQEGFNATKVSAGATAVKELAIAAKNIPTSGGLWDVIAGSNGKGMEDFAKGLEGLGDGIYKFGSKVSQEGFDVTKVTAGVTAGTQIAEMAKKVPTSGGLWDKIAGENDLSTFSSQLEGFANGLVTFTKTAGSITKESVDASVYAGEEVAKVIKSMPTTGGWWDKIAGSNDMNQIQLGLGYLANGISTFVSRITSANLNVDGAVTKLNKLQKAVKDFVNLGGQSISSSILATNDIVASGLNTMLSGAIASVESNTETFIQQGAKMVSGFVNAIVTESIKIPAAFLNVITVSIGVMTSKDTHAKFYSAGSYLAGGFAQGITDNTYKAVNAATDMAEKANQAIRDTLLINSPSKVGKEDGYYFGIGFVNEITKFADKAYTASSEVGKGAIEGLNNVLYNMSRAIDDNIDTQPTIRPVLDLSDISSGANQLNGMFGTSSVGVLRANSISASMSRGQNGGNDDVISAIKDLRTSIENMSGDTYQINGITVDSGNEISAAFDTILRAANLERRR